MGTHYLQLSLEERDEIHHLFTSGTSLRSIAKALGRAPSTISREIKRNSKPTKQFAGGYRPERANELAHRRRRWDPRFKMHRQPALRKYVRNLLAMGWSPQQIAGRLTGNKASMRISCESIYRYIYHRANQRDPWHHLLARRKHRRGSMRRGGPSPLAFIKQRRTLDERPEEANTRNEPGHWEADLMMFKAPGQGVLVIHERLSRVTRIVRIENKTADHVRRKLINMMRSVPGHLRRTVTFDNGSEFAHHYKLANSMGMETFFCDPRAPWQKGGVENAIGRLRRLLPRKTDMNTVSQRDLRKIARQYNNTPRKCLDYKTPLEVFNSVALQP